MALISVPFTFTVGSTIVASQHNLNFSTIYGDYNGNIDNTNIVASAAIVDSKLATISTAGKVSGAALTSLTSVPSGAGLLPRANSQPTFVDRGDPASADVTQASLTLDAAWHDLDLSAVAPSGTIAVALKVTIVCNTANKSFQMRKKGNTNAINISEIDSQVVNGTHSGDFIVPVDSSRFIQYNGSSAVTWSTISITVKGWWL